MGPSMKMMTEDIEAIMLRHRVDFYFAGHSHLYETTWPLKHGQPTQKHFDKPQAPFYITSGAAGPPTWDQVGPAQPWSRNHIVNRSTYSRATFERGRLTWEQVGTAKGEVLDRFVVTK